eukprot:NODE_15240_length_1061_cov_4.608137.p7 GENE.NODE_15240_length_1061_cov_4.608137~~NODE_15240_length_1061_cov_4.608137.p7  ORF type:complete len:69 (-),score=0.69 NODE_15240_length_1061_cov_4.608137:174-380(-)
MARARAKAGACALAPTNPENATSAGPKAVMRNQPLNPVQPCAFWKPRRNYAADVMIPTATILRQSSRE